MWIFDFCLVFVAGYFLHMFVDVVKGIHDTYKMYNEKGEI